MMIRRGLFLSGVVLMGLVLVAREMRDTPGELLASLPQYKVSSSTQLADYAVTGKASFDTTGTSIPLKGATLDVTSGGTTAGSVEVTTSVAPHESTPPTIVRYGDVGIKPAGCTDCPVLDVNAVELQKEKMRDNQARISRLHRVIDLDRERIRKAALGMGLLKDVMGSAVFRMKEEMKKLDVDMESKMLAAETMHGPPGDQGPKGFPGYDGAPGGPGENGPNGRQGRQGDAGGAGQAGPRGVRGVPGPPGRRGVEGPDGPRGARGHAGVTGLRGPGSRSVDCNREGGQAYKGVCFKASVLSRDADEAPRGCKPYTPRKAWTEQDWWELSRMFQESTVRLSSRIDRNRDGGRCDNHAAVMSFKAGEHVKTWVNSKVFAFSPTAASGGETCKLFNGEGTVAIYACTP